MEGAVGRPVANPAEFEGQWPWWGRWVGQWPTLPPPFHLHGQWPTLPSPPVSTNLNNNWYNLPVGTLNIHLWARLGHGLQKRGSGDSLVHPPSGQGHNSTNQDAAHRNMPRRRKVWTKVARKCEFGPKRGARDSPVPPPCPPGQNSTYNYSEHQKMPKKRKVCTKVARKCKFGPERGAGDSPVPPPLPTGAKFNRQSLDTPKNAQKTQSLHKSGM